MVAVTHPCIHLHNKSPGRWLTVDGQRWRDALWPGRVSHLRERLMTQKSQILGSGKEGQFIHNNGRWDSNGQTGCAGEQDIKNAANSIPSGWACRVMAPHNTPILPPSLRHPLGCLFAETQPSYSRNFQLATCLVLDFFFIFSCPNPSCYGKQAPKASIPELSLPDMLWSHSGAEHKCLGLLASRAQDTRGPSAPQSDLEAPSPDSPNHHDLPTPTFVPTPRLALSPMTSVWWVVRMF